MMITCQYQFCDFYGPMRLCRKIPHNKVRVMGHSNNMFTKSSENKSYCFVFAKFVEGQVCFKKRKRRGKAIVGIY